MVAALQRALAARGPGGAAGAGPGGSKRKAWCDLERQGKRAATAPLQKELSALAQERATTPVAIAANIIFR